MARSTDKVTHDLGHRLDRASAELRRSVVRVRRGPGVTVMRVASTEPLGGDDDPAASGRPRHGGALDQSIAALQAVVWIASFVQSVFNEIRGRADDF